MGVVSAGADVGRLHELGVQLISSGEHLDAVGDNGGHLLEVLTAHWSGPDLEEMSRSWPTTRQSVGAASILVREMGEQLRRQAEEQERASAGEGGDGPLLLSPGVGGPGGNHPTGEDPGPDAPRDELYGDLDPEIAAQWESMSDDERRAVLRELAARLAAEYGLPVPRIEFDPTLPSDTYGQFRISTGTITLNANHLDDPLLMLNSVAHEMRHAWQVEASEQDNPGWWLGHYGQNPDGDLGTMDEADAWGADLGDSEADYWTRPIEVDARQVGRDFIDDLTLEDFADLLRGAGQRP